MRPARRQANDAPEGRALPKSRADPAAGTYSVLEAAEQVGRNFLGCDVCDLQAER